MSPLTAPVSAGFVALSSPALAASVLPNKLPKPILSLITSALSSLSETTDPMNRHPLLL